MRLWEPRLGPGTRSQRLGTPLRRSLGKAAAGEGATCGPRTAWACLARGGRGWSLHDSPHPHSEPWKRDPPRRSPSTGHSSAISNRLPARPPSLDRGRTCPTGWRPRGRAVPPTVHTSSRTPSPPSSAQGEGTGPPPPRQLPTARAARSRGGRKSQSRGVEAGWGQEVGGDSLRDPRRGPGVGAGW